MRRRLRTQGSESGMTLIELLVASTMSVIVMGAVAMLVISAVKDQPKISKQAQNITTARWVLERLTHEIREGSAVKYAGESKFSFETYVRRETCGGASAPPAISPAIKCQVTYSCTATACMRTESPPGSESGTPRQIFSGIDSNRIFSYTPKPSIPSAAGEVTYVKATLQLPNPSGTGALTVSNGASLRNATLGY